MSLAQRKYCEHLSLRKPTKVDQLVSSVQKPSGAVPVNGMPLWAKLQLDAKLPVLSGPKSLLAFSRNKLGRKLWHTTARTEFLLSDPNCLDVSYHYEALHDENLRSFFQRTANQRQIKELGLVDGKGDAICTLKDYNEYRRYLKRVQVDAVNRERSQRDARSREESTLAKAQRYLQQDLDYQRRYAERMENMRHVKQQIEEGYRVRREGWLASMRATTRRLHDIARRKREDVQRRAIKMQALEDNVHARVAQGRQVARKKKLRTLMKWTRGDVERARRKAAEGKRRDELRAASEVHRWYLKADYQQSRIQREKEVLAAYTARMEERVHARNVKVAQQRAVIEEKLLETKMLKVKTASGKSHLWTTDHMVDAFLKAWEAEHHGYASVEDKRKIVASLMMQLAEAKNKPEGKEVLSLLQEAKQKLDKEAFLPEPVTCVINALLNNVIEEYVREKVESVITTVAEKAEGCNEQLEKIIQEESRRKCDDGTASSHSNRHRGMSNVSTMSGRSNCPSNQSSGTMLDHPSFSNKRMSVVVAPGEIVFLPSISDTSIGGGGGGGGGGIHSSQHSARSSPTHRRHSNPLEQHNAAHRFSAGTMPRATRIVSFGRITTVLDLEGLASSHSSETDKQYMKVKDRPPTPVPSLGEIVEAIFKEPVLLERDEQSAHLEKESLDKLFLTMSKCLLSIVLGKALKEMQIRHKASSNKYIDVDPMDKRAIVEKFTRLILDTADINFNDCAEVNFVSDEIVRMMIVKHKRHSSLSIIPEGRYERRSSTKSTERRHSSVARNVELALSEKRNSEEKAIHVKKTQVKF